jgi:hypothetical protein
MSRAKISVSVIAVLTVVACSQESGSSGRVSGSVDPTVATTTNEFRPGDLDFFASKGPVPVMVQGSAFGLDRASLERTVASDMQGANWGPDARFIPASQLPPNASREYSVVMALNLPKDVNVDAFCAQSMRQGAAAPSPSPATPGDVRAAPGSGGRANVALQAVLCHNSEYVRTVSTGADNVSGPNDPAFHKMIRNATTVLTGPTGATGGRLRF